MGYASLFEDSQDVKFQAFELSERLKLKDIAADEAEKLVNGLLKRCKHIQDTISEISSLHSDISRDTRNRIYSLRLGLEEAREKIGSLESELQKERNLNDSIRSELKSLKRSKTKMATPPKPSISRGRTKPPVRSISIADGSLFRPSERQKRIGKSQIRKSRNRRTKK